LLEKLIKLLFHAGDVVFVAVEYVSEASQGTIAFVLDLVHLEVPLADLHHEPVVISPIYEPNISLLETFSQPLFHFIFVRGFLNHIQKFAGHFLLCVTHSPPLLEGSVLQNDVQGLVIDHKQENNHDVDIRHVVLCFWVFMEAFA
jgi:hypothetical protein